MEPHELNRMFDRLAPTAEQEQEGLNRLLQTERKVIPMKKLKKLTAVGIAAALMVISCAAAVVTGIDQKIMGYFGIASEQESLMFPAAVRVEKSHTYENGWTLDIRQAMSDRYSMAVLVDVTAPEGTQMDGVESYLKIQPDRKGGGAGYGSYYLGDETLEDNQASYLFVLNFDHDKTDLIGSKWELTPELFLCVEQDGTSREIMMEGWTCTLSLSKQDPGWLYELKQPIDVNGDNLTLEEVYLSPISIVFRLRNGLDRIWDNGSYLYDGDWQNEIVLHTKSGETLYMGDRHMGGISNPDPENPDASYAHFQFSPEKIIDPAEITSVTLYGQTYELK